MPEIIMCAKQKAGLCEGYHCKVLVTFLCRRILQIGLQLSRFWTSHSSPAADSEFVEREKSVFFIYLIR